LALIKTWAIIHHEILSKFKNLKFNKGIKAIASSDEYARQFNSILKLYAPPSDPDFSHLDASLIADTPDNNINMLLNELKFKAI
jgi:hypothetical protein